MNPFEFALGIVALVFLFKFMNTIVRAKRLAPREDPVVPELLARLSEVEERVRVLERIVTDERYDLKQQFKDLAGE
jgi:hypothetical protein